MLNAHALPIVPINHSGLVSFNINAISAVPVVVPPPSAACAGSQVTKKLVSENAAVFDLSSSTLTRFCVWIPALTLPPHLGNLNGNAYEMPRTVPSESRSSLPQS